MPPHLAVLENSESSNSYELGKLATATHQIAEAAIASYKKDIIETHK
jgi:hypothetical protein